MIYEAVLFSLLAPSGRLCFTWRLSVCLLATSRKNYWSEEYFEKSLDLDHLSVCLSVCWQIHIKTTSQILLKILPEMYQSTD